MWHENLSEKPNRVTREQRRSQTRESLLTAALEIFSQKGYLASSVEDITDAAGYTRGAFYSNFQSKQEMLLELLKRDQDDMESDLQAILLAAGTQDEMGQMLLTYYRRLFLRRESFLLWMECSLEAAREPKFQAHFNTFLHDRQERMTACIREIATHSNISLALPAEVLALGLIGLCTGVQSCCPAGHRGSTDGLVDAVLAGFFSYTVLKRAPGVGAR
jgi:AcrR family transcriptional regulator